MCHVCIAYPHFPPFTIPLNFLVSPKLKTLVFWHVYTVYLVPLYRCASVCVTLRVFVVPEQWRRLSVRATRAHPAPAARHCFGSLERLRLSGMRETPERTLEGCVVAIHKEKHSEPANMPIIKLKMIKKRLLKVGRYCDVHLELRSD